LSDVSIPPRIKTLANDERLGELRSVHDPRTVNRRARIWLVVLGLPGLVLLPFAVRFLFQGLGWASVLSVLLTAGYLGAAGWILVHGVLPGYGQVLYLFEDGLILTTRRDATAVHWDSVDELRLSGVRVGMEANVSWRFVVVRRDGVEVAAGGEFPGVHNVVEAISEAVTARVLPKYLARIEAGATVRVGPFTVTREGIAKDGEEMLWRHVSEVEIRNGMVHVNRMDKAFGLTATAGAVPNAVAFAELARHVREGVDAE
jgi:hypothetical protein